MNLTIDKFVNDFKAKFKKKKWCEYNIYIYRWDNNINEGWILELNNWISIKIVEILKIVI